MILWCLWLQGRNKKSARVILAIYKFTGTMLHRRSQGGGAPRCIDVAMPPPPQSILDNNKDLAGRAGAKGARGSGLPIDMLGPPIKKLTLLKTAVFVLNFKVWPPLMNAWPPKWTVQLPALDLGN